jgi:hypothetical protein
LIEQINDGRDFRDYVLEFSAKVPDTNRYSEQDPTNQFNAADIPAVSSVVSLTITLTLRTYMEGYLLHNYLKWIPTSIVVNLIKTSNELELRLTVLRPSLHP